jgi:hypothetical protein
VLDTGFQKTDFRIRGKTAVLKSGFQHVENFFQNCLFAKIIPYWAYVASNDYYGHEKSPWNHYEKGDFPSICHGLIQNFNFVPPFQSQQSLYKRIFKRKSSFLLNDYNPLLN